MESWRIAWREGFAPALSLKALTALRDGLAADDPRITQRSTTTPPPLMCVQDWPVEAGDAIAFAGWQGDGLQTVGQVEEHFARCCFETDKRIGEAGACRPFLEWFDREPRAEVFSELLSEVERAIAGRECDLCGQPMGDEDGSNHIACESYEQALADGQVTFAH